MAEEDRTKGEREGEREERDKEGEREGRRERQESEKERGRRERRREAEREGSDENISMLCWHSFCFRQTAITTVPLINPIDVVGVI